MLVGTGALVCLRVGPFDCVELGGEKTSARAPQDEEGGVEVWKKLSGVSMISSVRRPDGVCGFGVVTMHALSNISRKSLSTISGSFTRSS